MRTLLFLAVIILGIGSYAAIYNSATINREANPVVARHSVDGIKTQVSDHVDMNTAPRPTRISSAATI